MPPSEGGTVRIEPIRKLIGFPIVTDPDGPAGLALPGVRPPGSAPGGRVPLRRGTQTARRRSATPSTSARGSQSSTPETSKTSPGVAGTLFGYRPDTTVGRGSRLVLKTLFVAAMSVAGWALVAFTHGALPPTSRARRDSLDARRAYAKRRMRMRRTPSRLFSRFPEPPASSKARWRRPTCSRRSAKRSCGKGSAHKAWPDRSAISTPASMRAGPMPSWKASSSRSIGVPGPCVCPVEPNRRESRRDREVQSEAAVASRSGGTLASDTIDHRAVRHRVHELLLPLARSPPFHIRPASTSRAWRPAARSRYRRLSA